MVRHHVTRFDPGALAVPAGYEAHSRGFRRAAHVDGSEGSVHAGFATPGDVAWAGVGCVHAFCNRGDRRVRWLETQAPLPPAAHSYRFNRDWDYLAERRPAGRAGEGGG